MASDPVHETPAPPPPQKFVGVNLHPQLRLVEIKTRPNFALHDQSAVVSYDVIEGLFLTLLTLRLHERGIQVGVVPMQTPPPQ